MVSYRNVSAFVSPSILAGVRGIVDAVKIFLTSGVINQQKYGCHFSCCVMHVDPKNCGMLGGKGGGTTPWYGAWVIPPRKHALPHVLSYQILSLYVKPNNKPTPSVLQAGCPSCRPTNSVKALKGKITTFHGLAHSKLTWSLPTVSLTTKGSWLPRGRIANPLISPLTSVPHDSALKGNEINGQTMLK